MFFPAAGDIEETSLSFVDELEAVADVVVADAADAVADAADVVAAVADTASADDAANDAVTEPPASF